MAKKDEILELLNAYKSEVDNFNDAVFTDKFEVLAQDIVKLFAIPVVSNSRLTEIEQENKKLRFIIENGLGEKDLENDCC